MYRRAGRVVMDSSVTLRSMDCRSAHDVEIEKVHGLLHLSIVGPATTQRYGIMNVPARVEEHPRTDRVCHLSGPFTKYSPESTVLYLPMQDLLKVERISKMAEPHTWLITTSSTYSLGRPHLNICILHFWYLGDWRC